LLCGTPRTGSTLLCSLLASTGVAGRPESYFREPDEAEWAARFRVPIDSNGAFNYRQFVNGAVRAGSTANGIFGARVMWGTLSRVVEGSRRSPRQSDLEVLREPFGPMLFVHLQRRDRVAQAVSWARAEQTGYWQQGDVASVDPHFDATHIEVLTRTIADHNAAWTAWFAQENVRPHVVTYEDLVANPRATVRGILEHLAVEPPSGWEPASQHVPQADEVNQQWVRRYKDPTTEPSER
jgi:LPS sulfotransferase NodH